MIEKPVYAPFSVASRRQFVTPVPPLSKLARKFLWHERVARIVTQHHALEDVIPLPCVALRCGNARYGCISLRDD
jgi:hypothetical protein